MNLLLHVCCGPCSTEAIMRLATYNTVLFFYNPNIYPKEEYIRRLEAAQKLANMLGLDFIVCGYEYDVWQNAIAGLENEAEGGRRCTECFRIRLAKTAQFAKKKNFNAFTTTLTISPHKNSKIINAIGNEIALKDGITFLEKDLKKEGGFRKSLEYSKKYGLYRQNYCGCEFSVKKTF